MEPFTWEDKDGDEGTFEPGAFGGFDGDGIVGTFHVTLGFDGTGGTVYINRKQAKKLRKKLKRALKASLS